MGASDPLLSPSDRKAIKALLWALKPLNNLRGSIPLPFAITFLFVALDEGQTINSYARATGINRFMMYRYMRSIGDRARSGSPGLGLVTTEPHPTFPNRQRVYLTAKGRSVAKEIFQQMRRAELLSETSAQLLAAFGEAR